MIKRRGRDFDSALLRCFSVGWQHFADQFAFALNNEMLIFQAETVTLLDEPRKFGLLKKKLIEPRQLGQHLQVSKILKLKILGRTLWAVPRRAKPIP